MNTLTTVKTFADVRQVLRGQAARLGRGRRTTTTAAFERAAAKAKEEKERIAPERVRPRARDGAASNRRPNKPRGTKNASATTCVERGSTSAAGFFAREQICTDERRGGLRSAGRIRGAAGGARRAHQGAAAQLSVSVFMQDKC
jgi:hypothetical protein